MQDEDERKEIEKRSKTDAPATKKSKKKGTEEISAVSGVSVSSPLTTPPPSSSLSSLGCRSSSLSRSVSASVNRSLSFSAAPGSASKGGTASTAAASSASSHITKQ
jgi:hypothetical protein